MTQKLAFAKLFVRNFFNDIRCTHTSSDKGGSFLKSKQGLLRWPFLLPWGLLTPFLVSCSAQDPQNTLAASGLIAQKQQDLFWLILGIAAIIFVLVEGLLLITVLRFRRRPGQGVPPQTHGNTRLEIAWTIAPALVLVVIAVPTVTTIFETASTPPLSLRVNVIGHQWWWEFEYPDLGVVTANELHIPVGEAIALELTTKDVIHSFWVPKLAGKTDMIRGRINTMWIKSDTPGTYLGQCAELCGIQHGLMRLLVIVQPRNEFEAWVKAQRAPATPPPGELSGTLPPCYACHTIQGVPGAVGKLGPNLTHVASRSTIVSGYLDNTLDNLKRWLEHPQSLKTGALMPNMNLNPSQVTALADYLQTLK